MARWNHQSNVADVLSLGPRTAGKLLQVGVRTAGELLEAKSSDLADRLNEPLFSVDAIAAWKRETQLLLDLPELEGNPARVLAAIGFSRAEAVAKTTPTELLTVWETTLREEISQSWLQNSPQPSVREVNSWIQQAQQASEQRAA